MLQCFAVYCRVLQGFAGSCSALQCVVMNACEALFLDRVMSLIKTNHVTCYCVVSHIHASCHIRMRPLPLLLSSSFYPRHPPQRHSLFYCSRPLSVFLPHSFSVFETLSFAYSLSLFLPLSLCRLPPLCPPPLSALPNDVSLCVEQKATNYDAQMAYFKKTT